MENNTQEQVLNLDLSATAKKKVTVNGSEDNVFYINPSDFGIYGRLKEGSEKLYKLFFGMKDRLAEVPKSENTDGETTEVDENAQAEADADELITIMKDTDAEMRSIIDFIFDAPVSDVCSPDGYLFDMFEGQLRFEYIITAITRLYENNITAEFYKVKSRINAKLPAYAKNGKK